MTSGKSVIFELLCPRSVRGFDQDSMRALGFNAGPFLDGNLECSGLSDERTSTSGINQKQLLSLDRRLHSKLHREESVQTVLKPCVLGGEGGWVGGGGGGR